MALGKPCFLIVLASGTINLGRSGVLKTPMRRNFSGLFHQKCEEEGLSGLKSLSECIFRRQEAVTFWLESFPRGAGRLRDK